MDSLTGRVAVVTGASSGIGRAVCLELLSAGASVVANARRMNLLEKLKTESAAADRLRIFAGDASDPRTIEELLNETDKAFGPADLVVVNAGRGLSGSLLNSDPSQWEEMIRTNLLGAMRLMRAAGQRMLERAKKQPPLAMPLDIIVVGSNVGRHVSPFSSAYGSTKFAIHSVAEALRRELGPAGIRVSLVEPGIVRSGFQEVAGYTQKWFDEFAGKFAPILEPADVAKVICFVASQPSRIHINDIVVRPTRQDYP